MMTPDPFAHFLESIQALIAGGIGLAESLMQPGWRQYQMFILLGLALISWGLHHATGNWLQNWVRSREGWSKWQLRMVVQVKRRLGLMWFALLAGTVYLVVLSDRHIRDAGGGVGLYRLRSAAGAQPPHAASGDMGAVDLRHALCVERG